MVKPRTDIDWQDVRKRIEDGESYRSVAILYNTTHANIRARCLREGWNKPRRATLTSAQAEIDTGIREHTTGVTPTHRNDRVASKIIKNLKKGASYAIAAHMAGITVSQLEHWRKKDERFNNLCQKARGNRAMKLMGMIDKAAERGDSKAAQWLLGRTYPEYNDEQGSSQGGITVVVNVPTPQPEKVVEGVIIDQKE